MNLRVVVAISGGIAAYKVPLLIRMLKKAGCEVKVVVTKNALEFVTIPTLQTLSQNPVYSDMFSEMNSQFTQHISLADWADIYIVAPATANVIGKYANGIADDCLTTTLLAFDKTVFFAPAMNTKMYHNKVVQDNIKRLQALDVKMILPEKGELACGVVGDGRMAEPENIFKTIEDFFRQKQSFAGKKVCITAGPTYEQIDAVRFIGNYSSGRMGFELARVFAEKGAEVCLITGPTQQTIEHGNVKRFDVKSAAQMYDKTVECFESCDIAILSAAVADYTPKSTFDNKLKKKYDNLVVELVPTKDILAELGRRKKANQILVGFALETDNELENAKEKLSRKNLDCIVLNSLNDQGAGFNVPTNKVTILDAKGEIYASDLKSKYEVALDISEKILNL
ncbi:MAG: bifunctional phosphopantothenoylcysteine decarboxylase/phosphopantothenate--cysteine ligase CoaBC [Bacteroidales bacterium]|nr:bifunctional phosphopantothenoylcysteine decarboxylase/phosphopantothenate--cysteine ligase CoaBC [Bacteroidales bacterium]